jgi:hypothetical protein
MSNIIYKIDTTDLSTFQVLVDPTFPKFTNVSGGYFDGRFLNITGSNYVSQYDLVPFKFQQNSLTSSAIVNYAALTQEEVRWLNSGPLDYLFTQIQQSNVNNGYYMVDLLNPTKEIILNGPLSSFKMFLNGNLNINPSKNYMSNVSQLLYHSRAGNISNLYCVPFSFAPEMNVPSGHINMSRIKEKVFACETSGPVSLIALNHNIFRVRDGLGGLVFNTRFN